MLTQEQQRVYDWINSELNLPTYASAYSGAVHLMKTRPSAHVMLVAHTARDLMNGLAPTYVRIPRIQAQYHQHLDDLQKVWKEEWGERGFTTPDHTGDGHLLPHDVCQIVQRLIDERKAARKRNNQADLQFFITFFGYDEHLRPPDNFLEQWTATKEWFLGRSHVPNEPWPDDASSEVRRHFGILHGLLYAAASSTFERLKGINEILDETNQ